MIAWMCACRGIKVEVPHPQVQYRSPSFIIRLTECPSRLVFSLSPLLLFSEISKPDAQPIFTLPALTGFWRLHPDIPQRLNYDPLFSLRPNPNNVGKVFSQLDYIPHLRVRLFIGACNHLFLSLPPGPWGNLSGDDFDDTLYSL